MLGQINATESLFQYEQGQTVETLSVPDHIPPFLDNIRARLEGNSTLTDTCGSNTQCLFDFDQTGNEAVGMATMDFMQEVMEEVIMSGRNLNALSQYKNSCIFSLYRKFPS